MRARSGAAAAGCIAVGLVVLALTATGAPPVGAKSKPHALSDAQQLGAHVSNFRGDDAIGLFTNLTPYMLTFVSTYPNSGWSDFPATLKPGENFVYALHPNRVYATTRQYLGRFTYRADTLNHPEYLTLYLFGSHCWGICLEGDGPSLVIEVHNTTAAPVDPDFGPVDGKYGVATLNPEIGWTASGITNVWPRSYRGLDPDQAFDFTFQTRGTYTLDASKAPPQLVDLLNAMCAGATGTSCSFTPTGPLTWGIGDISLQGVAVNCTRNPPNGEPLPPNRYQVAVKVTREASVGVGGSLKAGVEVEVFNAVALGVSAKFGVEHEWSDTTDFEKTTTLFLPSNYIGGVWVAPVVGKVTGTLVVSTGLAKYTITNFGAVKSGVSKDLRTPAFDIMTNARPLTQDEYGRRCASKIQSPTSGLG